MIDTDGPSVPLLSLVVATLGRTVELNTLFDSLEAQSLHDFELVVVDQNDDDRLVDLIAARADRLTIRHLRTPHERGLSRARNRGWRIARGRILLFPDDDCWYPATFLADAIALMDKWQCDVLAGRAARETGESINGRYEPEACRSERTNVWTTGIEWVMFFRREVLDTIGGYEEDVGVGASTPWQACEGVDIVMRANGAGFVCWFDPALAGHHAEIVVASPDAATRRKARAYGRGMGHVLRRFEFGISDKLRWLLRPGAGAALSLVRGRTAMSRYYLQVVMGRFEGMLGRTLD